LNDAAIAAGQRVQAALAVVGPELGGLLVDVCCLLVGLEEVERNRRWPRRCAKVVLRLALGQLARYYGLAPPEAIGQHRRSHHWGRDGYRPEIDGGAPTAGGE
jgi:hypothetical protein